MRIQDSEARMQDSGFRIRDSALCTQPLNPESCIPNPILKRLRWRCRRGLLELDIVLGRFIELHYAGLGEAQRAEFDALLDMPDTELWDMITGKAAPREESRAVLELLRVI